MMDLPTLQRTVADSLRGTTFNLAAATLGSTSVSGLFAALFTQPALTLNAASVNAQLAQPTAQGTLASTPEAAYSFLSGMQVTATFSLDSTSTPQLHLTLTPPSDGAADWGLPQALPALRQSFFNAFKWANARFDFDTTTPVSLPASFPAAYGFPQNSSTVLAALQRGMSFSADVTYRGTDAGLVWLLGGRSAHVSGPIEWDGALPRMDLASGPLTTLDLAGFTLPISLRLVSLLQETAATQQSPASLSSVPLGVLAGTLTRPINETQSLEIPFAVELYQDPARQVTVAANFQETSSLALAEVASLLGVESLASQQSGAFPALSALSLQTVSLTIDSGQRQLVMASATVAFTPPGGPWQPFGDLLTFDGLSVTFMALGPLSAPTLLTEIDARATLAGGELTASVSLPSLDFGCELSPTSPPINLTDILKDITGGAFGNSFQLLCTQLRVLGNPTQNYYRFQATVSDDWTFNVLGANFALSSVGFDLTRQAAPGGASSTTGQVVAQLLVAGVPVQISAAYLGGQQGWSFRGGTVGQQNISLTDLISDALKLFGLSLPSYAPQISITDLQMFLETAQMDFGFSCDGVVTMLGTQVSIGIDLGRTHDDANNPKAVTTTFKGYLGIGPSTFEVDFTSAPSGNSLLFTWTDTEQPLSFEDIAGFFGYDMPALPENLDLSLTAAEFYYNFQNDTFAVGATSKNYGRILFSSFVSTAPSPNQGQRVYVFEVDVPLNVELSDLPLVGDKLPSQLALGVKDLQVIISSATLPAASDMKTLNSIITAVGMSPPMPTTLNSGLTFAAALSTGTSQQPIILPLTGGASGNTDGTGTGITAGGGTSTTGGTSTGGTSTGATPSTTPAYKGAATWFNIEKSFGPVQFKRIGVQYQESVLFFLLDASLNFSALVLALDGLGMGSPLTRFSPVPHLDGISVSFTSGPVTVDGGLLVVPANVLPAGVDYEYMGAVTISVKPYLITGVASYARVNGAPSFFLFAQVTGDFGGPPAFFITGFMGGFGYNSRLTIPGPVQVYQFPFVAGLDDASIFGATPTPLSVLNVLSGAGGKPAWVTPATGENWIAAGILFRSFELVLGRALLIVTFGKELEVALLGLASLSLPQGAPPAEVYAFVELQLEAIFKPNEGFFGIFASLTPTSFLLTRACRLTGGFAFCLWFDDNPHAGDFVVTVGGYHPAFKPPQWYPQVSPVGFNWPVNAKVTVKGGAYFALTPTAIMAGGSLQVLYQSGNLRAWFTAYANLLVFWKPFQFKADIGISIGASYRLKLAFTTTTVKAELGATLTLWGPPTGGTVHVSWYVISFSVSFGADESSLGSTRLDWRGLQTLLPAGQSNTAPSILGVQINAGLSRQDSATGAWLVRGDEMVFTTQTAIPASLINLSPAPAAPRRAAADDGNSSAGINIRPMGLANVSSTHTVEVTNLDEGTTVDLTTWGQAAQKRNLPEALWGAPLGGATPPPSAATVSGQTGIQLSAPPPQLGPTPGPVAISLISAEPLPGGSMPLDPATQADPIAAPVVSTGIIASIAATLASDAAQQAQQALVAALAAFDAAPPTAGLLTNLAAQAGAAFPPPGPLSVATD